MKVYTTVCTDMPLRLQGNYSNLVVTLYGVMN